MLSEVVCASPHVCPMDKRPRDYSMHFLKLTMPRVGLLDHGTSPNAPPRESVELRSYCFWEDLPQQEAAMQL